MSAPAIDLTFPHTWSAEILTRCPLIRPARQFVYPNRAEDVERGALEVMVRPAATELFLATFDRFPGLVQVLFHFMPKGF
jgi:hypothetical protein